jgi:hypothetical protein
MTGKSASISAFATSAVGTPLHSGQVPRTASVENVAAALDCAASTASNHLRKVQAQLARTIADS